MERSEDLGEECCSSESGWTMYIASPLHENKNHDDDDDDDDDGDGDGDDDDDRSRRKVEDEAHYDGDRKEEGSDDSMDSDASSGPSHHQMVLRDIKHAKGIQQRKSSGKSPHNKVDKNKCDRKKKQENEFSGNGAKARKP